MELVQRTIESLETDFTKEAKDRLSEYRVSIDTEDPMSEYDLLFPSWIECLYESISVLHDIDLKNRLYSKHREYLYQIAKGN